MYRCKYPPQAIEIHKCTTVYSLVETGSLSTANRQYCFAVNAPSKETTSYNSNTSQIRYVNHKEKVVVNTTEEVSSYINFIAST